MSKQLLKHNVFLMSAAKTAVWHGYVRACRKPISGSGERVVQGMIQA